MKRAAKVKDELSAEYDFASMPGGVRGKYALDVNPSKPKIETGGYMAKHAHNLETIQNKLLDKLPDLREKYAIKKLGIFGSFLHGTQTKKSDLDLLVEFDKDAPLTLVGFVKLERELTKYLGIRVDLVERDTLKPTIGKQILSEVVEL